MKPVEQHRALVFGATGYTGQEVVAVLREQGAHTVAHVRPDSSRLHAWSSRFEALGAHVDTSEWSADSIRDAMDRHAPTVVFALLGTTQKRARRGEKSAVEDTYEAVDYGLTRLAIDAAASMETPPTFIYLSSMGVKEGTNNAYLRARLRVEHALDAASLPWLAIRASFITGSDREESRPAERIGAVVTAGFLGAAAAFGAKTFRDRYAPRTGRQLAEQLVRCVTWERRGSAVHLDEIPE